METIKVLSIDIGIINLGYVFAELSETVNVLECNRINITHMKHNKVKRENCQLHHECCIPDYLDHFIQEYIHLFDSADTILIERQPVMGLMNVQDLLFIRFRKKIRLISPNSVHKFFKMTKGEYEIRKNESNAIAIEYLEKFVSYQNNERRHDISDAMLMVLYYFKNNCFKKIIEVKLPFCKAKLPFNSTKFDITDLEQFRFIPVQKSNLIF